MGISIVQLLILAHTALSISSQDLLAAGLCVGPLSSPVTWTGVNNAA